MKPINVLGYFAFCLVYFLIQNMAFVTMWFANLAHVNVGVITVIWSVLPLFLAIADYCIFDQKLKYYHFIGMFLIIVCTVLISLQRFIVPSEPTSEQASTSISNNTNQVTMAPIVPVIFGILTPIVFTVNGILIRKLTSVEHGFNFNASDMSMSGYFFVNLLILIFSVFFWQSHEFDMQLFILGTIGSIINTIGISLNTTAYAKGPLGPVSAIAATSNILLVIEEAIRKLTVPSWVEFLALIIGFLGALELVFPEIFEKMAECIFGRSRRNEVNEDNGNKEQALDNLQM